jgi:hypothetical protein
MDEVDASAKQNRTTEENADSDEETKAILKEILRETRAKTERDLRQEEILKQLVMVQKEGTDKEVEAAKELRETIKDSAKLQTRLSENKTNAKKGK